MKHDDSSYTVTSPDLMLTESGVSVLLSSTDTELVEETKLLIEQWVQVALVFYVQPTPTTKASLPWFYHVSLTADLLIIDVDTCAWSDILTATINHKGLLVFYSPKRKKQDAIKVLHASAKYPIIYSREDLKDFLAAEFNADRDY